MKSVAALNPNGEKSANLVTLIARPLLRSVYTSDFKLEISRWKRSFIKTKIFSPFYYGLFQREIACLKSLV